MWRFSRDRDPHHRGQRHPGRGQRPRGNDPAHRGVDRDHGETDHHHEATRMNGVGVPGEQGRAHGRAVGGAAASRRQPGVHGQQPRQDHDREDRVGQRVLGVEHTFRHDGRDRRRGERDPAAHGQAPEGQVGQRHEGRVDHGVDHHGRVIGDDRVAGEPVDRHQQQRVAALVQGPVGEVGRRPGVREHARDHQVRGFVRVGQRHGLRPAEPYPQRHLSQVAEHEPEGPPPRPAPGSPGCHAFGRRGPRAAATAHARRASSPPAAASKLCDRLRPAATRFTCADMVHTSIWAKAERTLKLHRKQIISDRALALVAGVT